MPRTVDPERHRARRLAIIDAALTCFARGGVHGTTTAQICREAGIGSGTFFHYFPAKLDVLRAIIELGIDESEEWFAAQQGRDDAFEVLLDHADRVEAETADPRVPGFVAAVAGAMAHTAVAEVLDREQRVLRAGLLPWLAGAQRTGHVRTDWTAERAVLWLIAIEDGFVGSVASGGLRAASARGTLRDVIARVLRPAG